MKSLTRNTLTTGLVYHILVTAMSTLRTHTIWALCLYFAIGLTTGAHGSVLCIDPDESVRVEAICQTSCGDPETSCDAEQPGVETEVHPHCIGCTDIPLMYESLQRRDFVPNLIDDSAQLSLAQRTHADAGSLTVTRLPAPTDRGPLTSPLKSLSTVILIC